MLAEDTGCLGFFYFLLGFWFRCTLEIYTFFVVFVLYVGPSLVNVCRWQ